MRHLIDIVDLSESEINDLIGVANDIIQRPSLYAHCMEGKKLASLFFESSTRTRLSFEAAMYELGGHVLGFSDAETSSISKGESLQDTIRVVSGYADIIAMRHPKDGAALAAALASGVPVINAGDGSHNHPTQTLTDLLTIQREKGRLNSMTVGVCGDLRYGRTVHSLIEALARYTNMKFILIAPEELRVPDYVLEMLENSGHSYVQTDGLDAVLGELDILYMTRIQRERFQDPAEYEKLKDSYVLTAERMRMAKKDMSVLHPLPRVNEIATDVDEDPRAAYFRQARNGKYIRMALILKLLEEKNSLGSLLPDGTEKADRKLCRNQRCIMQAETGLKQYVRGGSVPKCLYCDSRI